MTQNTNNENRCVPRLFSTDMVKAIMNDTKSETRRIVKFPKIFDGKNVYQNGTLGLKYSFEDKLFRLEPPVQPGDVIWVRETFQKSLNQNEFCYKADTDNPIYLDKNWKWKPSLFMPKIAARNFLKVVSVHAERLHDIDDNSAINEGIKVIHKAELKVFVYQNYLLKEELGTTNPKRSFQSLWQKINGKHSWRFNPWVWVYKFERTDCPAGFC